MRGQYDPMLVNTYEIVKKVKGHVAHFRNIAFAHTNVKKYQSGCGT